jgi:hypothetical protein
VNGADGTGLFSLDSPVSSPSSRSRAGTRASSRSAQFTSTMQIDFSIASLALELRRNAGDNASDRLLSFEIGGLGVTLAKESNAAVADAAQMKCAVQLERLELYDSSAETERSGVPENFRQLLAVRASSARATAKPCVVRFSQSAKAGMELAVELQHVRLGFAGVLYSLASFFALPPPKPSAAAATKSASVPSAPSASSASSASSAAPAKRAPMKINVRVRHMGVHLVTSPRSQVSPALALRCVSDEAITGPTIVHFSNTIHTTNCFLPLGRSHGFLER